MTKIYIFCGPKMPKTEEKLAKKLQTFWGATNAPKSHLGSPMTKMCIFWGPNYLPHAAYKCISLFCNTFLASEKAVLIIDYCCNYK